MLEEVEVRHPYRPIEKERRRGMTIPPPSPNYRTGKICYIEIPAIDISQSAQFYQRAFGWQIRQRNDGSTAFDDTIGEVSGTWVPGRPPSHVPGLLVYIMVASAATDRKSTRLNSSHVR